MLKILIRYALKKLGYRIISETHTLNNTDFSRLKYFYKTKKVPLHLHVGCGPRILKNWINIDLSYEPYEKYLKYYTDKYYPREVRGDRTDLYIIDITSQGLPLPDNSVDIVFNEDFLEHLTQKQQIIFLAETYRVLKRGGLHRISTPNLLTSMKHYSNFELGRMGVYENEWIDHDHKNVLSPNGLIELAKMIGYRKIMLNGKNKSIKNNLLPREYRPAGSRAKLINANIFADLIK
jgi:predicted SAM-dependent methyltransferase